MHCLPLSHQASSIHFLHKPFFAKIYGFSYENRTISWMKKKKNPRILRFLGTSSNTMQSIHLQAAGLGSIQIQIRLRFIVLETAKALGDPRSAPDSWISGKLRGPDACMRAKSLQSYPTLCDSMDCSSPGSSVHGFLQTRILERVAMPSSRGSSQFRDETFVS